MPPWLRVRTIGEQTVLDRDRRSDGEARWIFRPAAKFRATTSRAAATGSKTVHAPRFDVTTDTARDALLTEFGKDTLRDRYLLPGESYQDLFARVAAAYADDADHAQRVYDYISKLVVHAGDARPVERRHRPRPSDQLLSEQRLRQPRRHRRHLERECLAGVQGRRHRHLLGQRPRHRRAGRPQRQDQRHHPVRAGDGQPDAGDQPGLAAPRLGRLLSRRQSTPRSRNSSRSANRRATSTARRSTSTTACSSPTRSWKRCATAPNSTCTAPKDGSVRGKVDARSLFQKLVETRLATGEPYIIFIDAVNKSMPKHHRDLGLKVTTSNLCSEITLPTGRDHLGADRTAVCCLSLAQPRDLGPVERRQAVHRGRHALPRQCAAATISPARPTRWRAPNIAPSASARSASA